jgi:hypothetical protein
MDEIVTIGSLTYAQKAKRMLAAKGIHVRLIKTDGGEAGCTYALAIPGASFFDAIAALRTSGIPYRTKGP